MDGSPDYQVAMMFAIGTAAMLMMAGTIIFFVMMYQKRMVQEQLKRQILEVSYQKKMLQAALESQEMERKRVSKDLHDDVGMMLMTMRVSLGNSNLKEANDLRELVDSTHETVRRISWDLMPSTLENFGLSQTLSEMCERLNSRNSCSVTFSETGTPQPLDKTQELLLYRSMQESVSNALKHARATQINVNMVWLENDLDVSVTDDGVGFDLDSVKNKISGRHGLGIFNLENRAELLGASLDFKRNLPTGTIVSVTLPLQAS